MDDPGYDISDPKHPDHYDVYADVWDNREKVVAIREDGSYRVEPDEEPAGFEFMTRALENDHYCTCRKHAWNPTCPAHGNV